MPRKPKPLPPTRGQLAIRWIEKNCRVPEGAGVGDPVRLEDWQRNWLIDIYDNPAGPTRRAFLSVGRKNGKTTLAACLVLLHLCGWEAEGKPNSNIYSTAQSRDQAALVFNLCAKMIRMRPNMMETVAIHEASKTLVCRELGTRYRALSAEVSTAFGLNPSLIIHDELGQVRGPRSTLYEALETATGAQEEPLSIIISTQAPTDADLLSILLDDALAGHDPSVVVRLFTAPMDADPFADDTIRQANPAFAKFLSAKEVKAMAQDASRMPAREAEYRNLILNQRVEVSNPFIAPGAWSACGGEVGSFDNLEVFAGLDLSEVRDLTALVLIAKRPDGKWHVRPTFWLPADGLREKSKQDRTPYDVWAEDGYLVPTPGKVVSYEMVAEHIRDLFVSHKIKKIGFDRWNMRHLTPWLTKAGMSDSFIKDKFVEFGQGWASMSPALRTLEQILVEGKMAHGNHPVLSMCVSNTIVVRDDAGNRKPSKKRSVGKIDGLVALAMAVGVAPLSKPKIDVEALIA
jgi:phage terminase large subunit-like protein